MSGCECVGSISFPLQLHSGIVLEKEKPVHFEWGGVAAGEAVTWAREATPGAAWFVGGWGWVNGEEKIRRYGGIIYGHTHISHMVGILYTSVTVITL